ncbi:E22 family MetX-like putative esterase [Paracraurococcus ruber]|uniref:Probable acyltransferase n=1 Tax=Paracraurococcus ruber TaxID=77675 RepID=A0ABS1D2A9_9PROT|nr:homoserine O-acetyltransferase [Paracraurococcus ruber]MBK1660648.1 homoserine acetyltransferase [Paracraurococcus ruber]TDG26599.1 homoserine O-acetyltransferase [Paracraurococcus ruber]
MIGRRDLLAAAALAATLPARPAAAQEVVEKRVFEAGAFPTRGGATIPNARIGYQTMGRLNDAGDNAVLICHFFSGNSHAFGRLSAGGPAGYWDAIIGPGKAIDTDRYFVVSADTLVNVNVPDANTVTTGPASINPDTGRPWGMGFPVVAMRDFVEIQKRLLDSLGVKRLALVAGPSNGGLQTIEWAAAYPEFVARAMPVIAAEIDAWMQGWLDIWEAPIRLDPNWREGDYYGQGREPPLRGLAEAWKIVTLHARDRQWARQYDRKLPEGQDPARRIGDRFAIEKWLDDAAAARARTSDANSFLYMVRANQLFLNDYPGLEAAMQGAARRWLIIPSPTDRVFLLDGAREFIEVLRKAGKQVDVAEVTGPLGHLNGVAAMAPLADRIRAFLAA